MATIGEPSESDEEDFVQDVSYPLKQFVKLFSLPQTVKITEGFYSEDVEFSAADVLVLQELNCENVTFRIKNERDETQSLRVPRNYQGTFKVLHSETKIYKTVADLVKSCPFIVKATKSFVGPNKEDILKAGDRLSLIRVVQNEDGVDLLECKRMRGSKLLLLTMECNSEFVELEIFRYYTIRELTDVLPRSRRLLFSDDYTCFRNPIRDMPSGYSGIILMEEPELKVTAHPKSNPGLLYHLDLETPIDVTPREVTYETVTTEDFNLKSFTQQNSKYLPFICRIMDWQEATFALEWHKMYPGTEVTLYKEEGIDKILAECGGLFYSIPLTYRGYFKLDMRTYQSVSHLEAMRPKCHLEVIVGAKCDIAELDDLCVGDILTLAGDDWCLKQFQPVGMSSSLARDFEVDVLLVVRHNRESYKPEKLLRVPLYMNAEFREVIQGSLPFTLEKVHLDYPVNVCLTHSDPNFGEESCLPSKEQIKLHGPYREDCILVCTHMERPTAPIEVVAIPLWTKISVSYVRKNNVAGKKGIQMINSVVNSCPDYVSPEEAKAILETKVQTYESIRISFTMPPSPREPKEKSKKSDIQPVLHKPKRPPKSIKLLGSLKSSTQPKQDVLSRSESGTTTDYGRVRHKSDKGEDSSDSDDEADYIKPRDYEYIKDIEEIKLPTKKLQIPKDGNLYNFSVNEMATFFAKMGVDKDHIIQCVQRRTDGHSFSKLSHRDMNTLGLTKNPVIEHFHHNTKPKSKLANIFRLT